MSRPCSGRGVSVRRSSGLALLLLASSAACAGSIDGEELPRSDGLTKEPVDGGAPSNDTPQGGSASGNKRGSTAAPKDACRELALEVESFVETRCSGCHGPGKGQGGFSDVLDVDRMIAQGKIVPGDAPASKLFTLVDSGAMPRTPMKATDEEIDRLAEWIDCGAVDWNAPPPSRGGGGATQAFVSIDDRLQTIYADLRRIENPADRQRMRYLDLSKLSNAGASEDEVEPYRQTISFAVNSLSKGNRVVASEAVDSQNLLYRIDLRDYGWSEETWDAIVADYPYAVRYDADSRLFPFDEDMADSIRQETRTDVPYIDGDWFLAHATLAPLYYDILEFPNDILELALDLGVDVEDDVRTTQVARAGFNSSGVSVNNRVIERHEQPGFGGAFWVSYDFAASDGNRNIFANPTDFRQDAGEGFFNLPNGLQAYFIQDGRFLRVDKADPAVVTDPNSKDRAVAPGLSCMGGCHLTTGILVKDDQVRTHVKSAGADAATREDTFALYPPIDDMRELMEADTERYQRALMETGFNQTDDNILNVQVRKHQDLLHVNEVAALLGISEDDFIDALDASPQAFPAEIAALRQANGTVYRDTLDRLFSQIVDGLGLGESIVPRSSSRSSVNSNSDRGSRSSTSSLQTGSGSSGERAGAGGSSAGDGAGGAGGSTSGTSTRRR